MSKILYQLFVSGTPKAQPRPRMTAKGHVYNPSSADAWKEEIMASFAGIRRHRPIITEPVRLKVTFFMPAPKGMKIESRDKCYVPHSKKPDTDNLLKAVMDSLTDIKVWADDALVFWTEAVKWCVTKDTGAQIIIETF